MLAYLEQLGVKAIWLSPVLKNARPDRQYNYHGYGQQDLLNVDERFASDGTRATAERELTELIDEAHAREIYVVLDIVLNHAARVFDYVLPSGVVSSFSDQNVMNGALCAGATLGTPSASQKRVRSSGNVNPRAVTPTTR